MSYDVNGWDCTGHVPAIRQALRDEEKRDG